MKTLILFLVLFLTVAVSAQDASINVNQANLRGTPSTKGKIVTKLRYEESVEIMKRSGSWYLVQANGYSGWLHRSTIAISINMAPQIPTKNLRAPPDYYVPTTTTNTYVVEPGNFMWIPITLDRGVNVVGRYTAQGGSGNDIEVFILDDDGLTNYRNGHSSPTFYNSNGRKTVGNFNTWLGTGTYYIVLNNKFSFLSNKVVTLTLTK